MPDVFEPEYIGRFVKIKNTLLFNGKTGYLEKASDDPADFWDYNVKLMDGTKIGVTTDQFILTRQCEAMHWYAENYGVQCNLEWDHELHDDIEEHDFS